MPVARQAPLALVQQQVPSSISPMVRAYGDDRGSLADGICATTRPRTLASSGQRLRQSGSMNVTITGRPRNCFSEIGAPLSAPQGEPGSDLLPDRPGHRRTGHGQARHCRARARRSKNGHRRSYAHPNDQGPCQDKPAQIGETTPGRQVQAAAERTRRTRLSHPRPQLDGPGCPAWILRFARLGVSRLNLAVFASQGEDAVMTQTDSRMGNACKSGTPHHAMGM